MELYTIGNKVTGAFEVLIEAAGNQDEGSPEYRQSVIEQQRFRLWSHSLGLLHHGHASLDYRVRDATIVRDRLADILLGLAEHLLELNSIYREERQPFENEDIESTDADSDEPSGSDDSSIGCGSGGDESGKSEMIPVCEVDFRLQSINESINALYSLATKIRHPRNRPQRTVAHLFKHVPADDLMQYIHERETVEASIVAYVQRQQLLRTMDTNQELDLDLIAEYASPTNWIIQRTAVANVRRKQQFIYWKEHGLRLSQGQSRLERNPTKPQVDAKGEGLPQLAEVTTSALTIHEAQKQDLKSEKSSPTSATRLNPDFIARDRPRSEISQPSRISTAVNLKGDTIEWPLPPNLKAGEEFFTCPYCNTICPKKYLLEGPWRAHLINDLQPLHCTYQDCKDPNRLYGSKQEWIDHENQHMRVWHCREHNEEFETQPDYVKHLETRHTDTLEHESPELIASALGPSEKLHRTCPYCPIDPSEEIDMQKHIVFHLERLATLALPDLDDESNHSDCSNDWDRSQNSQHVQRRGRQKSIAEDFNDPAFGIYPTVEYHETGSEKARYMLTNEFLQKVAYQPESSSAFAWVENLPSDCWEPDHEHPVHDSEPRTPDNDLPDLLNKASHISQEIHLLSDQASTQRSIPEFRIVHRITCYHGEPEQGIFMDHPTVVNYGPHNAHAQSERRIDSMESFLRSNKGISFLVYREYTCCGNDPPSKDLLLLDGSNGMSIKALFMNEYIDTISPELRKTIVILRSQIDGITFPYASQKYPVQYPYVWWFHLRSQVNNPIFWAESKPSRGIEAMAGYIQESVGAEWKIVDELLQSQKISSQYLHYLFVCGRSELLKNSTYKMKVPNEIIISQRDRTSDAASLEAFLLRDWASIVRHPPGLLMVDLDLDYWVFDGQFKRKKTVHHIDASSSKDNAFPITDLKVYPQRFANLETVVALRQRGKMFWKCRIRRYVEEHGAESVSRFMVDMKTYNGQHPRPPETDAQRGDQMRDYLDNDLMVEEYPDLGDDFFMCLPTRIIAFNMQKNEWTYLRVANIRDVEWNEHALERLAIEPSYKKLLKAMARAMEKRTDETEIVRRNRTIETQDMVKGKSRVVIISLTGGPGTGKTLTAEAVAEFVKKPLFKVVCADLGKEASEVEQNMVHILTLARVWKCVVLLDEAHVFLQERHPDDPKRNSLISVALRVLEDYTGLVIFTTQHNTLYDEEWKKRIHLNLTYSNLGVDQRRKIWEDSITSLVSLVHSDIDEVDVDVDVDVEANAPSTSCHVDIGIDTADIRRHLDDLALYELNGMQIRLAINGAWEMTNSQRIPMRHEHLLTFLDGVKMSPKRIQDLEKDFTDNEMSEDLVEG